MTTLVTGATGLLGSHVTDVLLARGERTRVLVRPGSRVDRPDSSNLELCVGDITDQPSLVRAVREVDRIIHCAARTGPWGPEVEYRKTNVTALRMLVDAAIAGGVQRFVHVSSITVHGNDLRGAADESAPLRRESNPYSRSKVAGEQLLQDIVQEQRAPVVIVRPGWIYGPRDTASFGRFAALIEHGRMVVVGSGGNHLPLVYVSDAAEAAVLASHAPKAAVGNAYLIVNDEPVTQWGYLSRIAAELGVPAPRVHIPYRPAVMLGALSETVGRLARRQRPPPVTRYGLQLLGGENRFVISRARQDLGFSPQVNLEEGVRQSVDWYRSVHDPAAEHRAA